LKNKSKASVLETLIPIERSDVENGTDDDAMIQSEEDETSEREKMFYFDTNLLPSTKLVPSPFRGLFLSRFNSGFADFENNLYFTAAPYCPPSNPTHVLDCSSFRTSRSSCDNKLCTVLFSVEKGTRLCFIVPVIAWWCRHGHFRRENSLMR